MIFDQIGLAVGDIAVVQSDAALRQIRMQVYRCFYRNVILLVCV